MLTSFDALLFAAAVLILGIGWSRRSSRWLAGQEEIRKGSLFTLIGYLLGSGKILKRPLQGSAHIFVFWGVVLPALAVLASQFRPRLPGTLANLVSLFLDLLGLAMLCALVFMLARRWAKRKEAGPTRTAVPALTLLGIVVTGFLAEGTRLSILGAGFSWQSPVGSAFSAALPASPLLMQSMIRLHFFAVLFLMASVPFTFLRHLAAGSLNVYYKGQNLAGQLRSLSLQRDYPGARRVNDFSWKQLLDAEACVSCGRCEENCPAAIAQKPLSPRKVVQSIQGQMRDPLSLLEKRISNDEIWSCTTCMACVERCPVFAEPLDKIMDMRRYRVMGEAALPSEAKSTLRNLQLYKDIYGKGITHRTEWAFNRRVPYLWEEVEVLLWVGCSGAFHPRYQETARAMVKILKAGGVRFGILGKEERCCGDPARRLGEESLYMDMAQENIQKMKERRFERIVALCPHCFNTLKNEYPSLGGSFRVVHATEHVAEMIRLKKIALKYSLPAKMALHDPCYLGRGNGVYKPLREIGKAIPGVTLLDLPRNRDRSFCCGGGGGRMWLHEKLGRPINLLRAQEVVESGAEVLGTACPYCLTMLEDGIKNLEVGKPAKVMDLVEIVASSIR
jgi:Fe-S oxidoreductase/nitrate reductase gamma subunit